MPENLMLKSVEDLKHSEYPIYVWGGGKLAAFITDFYKQHGIEITGYLLDEDYYEPGRFTNGKEELNLKDFFETLDHPIDLIIGFSAWTKKMANEFDYTNIHRLYEIGFSYDCSFGDVYFDEQFWNENKAKLLALREELCDEESKYVFDEYVYQRRTAGHWKWFSRDKDSEYFDENIIKFHDHEVMVDCGAYHGETAVKFKETLERRNIHTYKEIVAFEPDADNIAYIENQMEKIPDFRLVKKGVWDKNDVLTFSGGMEDGSRFDDEGENKIEVDSIDNVLGDTDATFIKMDVEGCELKALQGAKKQILKNRPKLAICVYHKKTDLIEIPEYLHSLVPDYKFYLRSYDARLIDTVLYAI